MINKVLIELEIYRVTSSGKTSQLMKTHKTDLS